MSKERVTCPLCGKDVSAINLAASAGNPGATYGRHRGVIEGSKLYSKLYWCPTSTERIVEPEVLAARFDELAKVADRNAAHMRETHVFVSDSMKGFDAGAKYEQLARKQRETAAKIRDRHQKGECK